MYYLMRLWLGFYICGAWYVYYKKDTSYFPYYFPLVL